MGKKARYGVLGKVAVLMEMLNADPWKYYPLNVQFLSTEISAERGRCVDPPPHVNLLTAPLASLVLENAAASQSVASGIIQQGYDLDEDDDDDEMESELVMSGLTTTTQQQQSESILCSDDDDDETENEATTRTSSQINNSKISIITTKKEAIATNKKKKKKKSLTSCILCGIAASRTWIPCPTCSTRCHVGCLAKHYLSIDPGGRTLPRNGHCPSCMTRSSWGEALGRTENVGWAQHKKKRTSYNYIGGAGEDDGEADNTTKGGAGGGSSRERRAGVGATPIKASQSESVVVGGSTTKKKKATLKGSQLNDMSNPLPPLPLGEPVATKTTVSQIEDLSSQQLQPSQQRRKAVPIQFDTEEDKEVDVGAYEAPPWDDYDEVVVIDKEEEEEDMDSNGTPKGREEEEIVIEDTPSPPPLMQRLMMTSKNVVGTAAAAKEKKEEEDVIVILDSDDEFIN